MLDITAFIMSICLPQRLEWLKQTVDLLDSHKFPFKEKLLVVDQFNGYTFSEELHRYYSENSWRILVDNHMSRAKSTTNALNNINTEWIFYNEEDVPVYFLDNFSDIIEQTINTTIDNKSCGMISLNAGGSLYSRANKTPGDIPFVKNNIIYSDDKTIVFKRLDEYRNPWFFCFPVLFIRKDIFKKCHEYALKYLKGMQIEMALTKAYFDLRLDLQYYKATMLKTGADDLLLQYTDSEDIEYSYMDLLDKAQGLNVYGNNHNYT